MTRAKQAAHKKPLTKQPPTKQATHKRLTYAQEKAAAIRAFNAELKTAKARVTAAAAESSISYRQIKGVAAALDALVRADDPRINGCVVIAHEDGSHMLFNYAWYETFGPDANRWLVIFTEHCGVHVFHTGDLSYYRQFRSAP